MGFEKPVQSPWSETYKTQLCFGVTSVPRCIHIDGTRVPSWSYFGPGLFIKFVISSLKPIITKLLQGRGSFSKAL